MRETATVASCDGSIVEGVNADSVEGRFLAQSTESLFDVPNHIVTHHITSPKNMTRHAPILQQFHDAALVATAFWLRSVPSSACCSCALSLTARTTSDGRDLSHSGQPRRCTHTHIHTHTCVDSFLPRKSEFVWLLV